MTQAPPLPLVLSMGEPAGIGPDLIAILSRDQQYRDLPPIIVAGDHAVLTQRVSHMGEATDRLIRCETPDEAHSVSMARREFAVLQTTACAAPVIAGKPDPANAQAVLNAIDVGLELIRNGRASALMTNPIQKETLYSAGFPFPGHTEYLAARGTDLFGMDSHPVMMIHTPALRTVPVTIHIPVSAVSDMLTTSLIVETCRITAHDLVQRFGIERPQLAIAGLNPHAGEGGTIGREDQDIVTPAIAELIADGLNVTGPHPADTMFHAAARKTYDAAICMYHDQALIPAKTLAFDVGVNTTLGLPFIRTSPDHGTALDIAGTGKARPDSLIAAIKLAADLASNAMASAAA